MASGCAVREHLIVAASADMVVVREQIGEVVADIVAVRAQLIVEVPADVLAAVKLAVVLVLAA